VFWLGTVVALCNTRLLVEADYLTAYVIGICGMLIVLYKYTLSEKCTENAFNYIFCQTLK
jgi:hypothetical protein